MRTDTSSSPGLPDLAAALCRSAGEPAHSAHAALPLLCSAHRTARGRETPLGSPVPEGPPEVRWLSPLCPPALCSGAPAAAPERWYRFYSSRAQKDGRCWSRGRDAAGADSALQSRFRTRRGCRAAGHIPCC